MTAKIIQQDNGYFEIWEKPDGTRVRVSTEDRQIALKNPSAREKFHAATRERLSQQ